MRTLAFVCLLNGVIICLLSLPLIYRKVPMNRFYGVRLKASFQSPESWYDINAYGGKQLALWSPVIVLTGLIGLLLSSEDPVFSLGYAGVVLVAVLVGAGMPLLRIMAYIRRQKSQS